MPNFYVTTPIYYVNDVPHLGTAYTTIVADALRRFHLLIGDDTYMLTGTDEHGQKIERQAKEQGLEPKAFTDLISERFREAWPKLEVEANRFIRTTDPDHEAFVIDLWKKIAERGDLYEGAYEGWYCVGCEDFKTEKELIQPGNICPLHKTPVERVKETSYFFRLSKWEKPLLDFYARHPKFIQPETRKNEVLSFVQGGLKDLSVSRTSFSWGIPVPETRAATTKDKHVMYVWFDALTNYRSALGHGELTRFWAPKSQVVHLVGKDILRFHAVFWPAFLLAAGYSEDEIPSVVFAHGFLTIDGQKMSKSLRNAVDPLKIASELGADVLRYHLLRAVSFGQDGDFDHAALLERYNADLGKNLGNLLNRTLGLCAKMTGGKAPKIGERSPLDNELEATVSAELDKVRQAWENLEPHRALEGVMTICSAANKYVDESAPWARAKDDPSRVPTILGMLLSVLKAVSTLIWPAMPHKSDEMRTQLGLASLSPKIGTVLWPSTLDAIPEATALAAGKPLFPTLDADQQKAMLDKLVPKLEAPAAPPAAVASQETPQKPGDSQSITYEGFSTVDLRVGVVLTCEKVPKKDKLLKLSVDVGEASPRIIVAGLALSFAPEDLVGKKVVVVANLAPRDFGKGLVSHGMLLATGPSEELILATVAGDATPGSRLK